MPLFSQYLQTLGLAHGFYMAGEPRPPHLAALVLPKQVHGDLVIDVTQLADQPADGLFSKQPAALGVQTADCVPLLLAHQAGIIAAIHAGWRGAAAQISENFLRLQAQQGVTLAGWTIAMGPAAGGCCYEVGPEVAVALGLAPQKQKIDLRQIIAKRLKHLGIEQIDIVGPCTICSKEGWASYRRDAKAAGRNIAAIAVIP